MHTAQRTRTPAIAEPTLSLTEDQSRALAVLMTLLDRTHGAQGPHMNTLFGRPRDIEAVLRVAAPDANRPPRTPEHRKVIAAYVDAAALPSYLRPWQSLIFELLETLDGVALPTERPALNALRAELLAITRLQEDADRGQAAASSNEGLMAATTAFVRRFRAALPSLILNTISLANSVLLFAIDNAHSASPEDTAQLLEAARYFLNTPSCAVLVCGDETLLVERLGRSTDQADGRAILRSWQTGRIDIGVTDVQPAFRGSPTPVVAPASALSAPRAGGAAPASRGTQTAGRAVTRPQRDAAERPAWLSLVSLPALVAGVVLALDQLSKLGVAGIPRTGIGGVLALGTELLGVSLAAMLWMGARAGETLRRVAYALIVGGLASSLIDGAVRGLTLAPFRIGTALAFSPGHVAALIGAGILGWLTFRRKDA